MFVIHSSYYLCMVWVKRLSLFILSSLTCGYGIISLSFARQNNCPFPFKFTWHLCWKSIDHEYKDLFLDSHFRSIDLFAYVCTNTTNYWLMWSYSKGCYFVLFCFCDTEAEPRISCMPGKHFTTWARRLQLF
jgi:hypothetical protein